MELGSPLSHPLGFSSWKLLLELLARERGLLPLQSLAAACGSPRSPPWPSPVVALLKIFLLLTCVLGCVLGERD
jgi:hypothetical protein